jgi:hypothetical protein
MFTLSSQPMPAKGTMVAPYLAAMRTNSDRSGQNTRYFSFFRLYASRTPPAGAHAHHHTPRARPACPMTGSVGGSPARGRTWEQQHGLLLLQQAEEVAPADLRARPGCRARTQGGVRGGGRGRPRAARARRRRWS